MQVDQSTVQAAEFAAVLHSDTTVILAAARN